VPHVGLSLCSDFLLNERSDDWPRREERTKGPACCEPAPSEHMERRTSMCSGLRELITSPRAHGETSYTMKQATLFAEEPTPGHQPDQQANLRQEAAVQDHRAFSRPAPTPVAACSAKSIQEAQQAMLQGLNQITGQPVRQ